MAISQHKSEAIGVLLETLAYGAYLVIFIQCLKVLQNRRTSSKPARYLLITAVLLFMLVTTHLVIDIDRDMEADATNSPATAEAYYDDLGTWKNVFKTACYVATTVVSDAFIVYRCFIVWGRNTYVAALPSLLFIADIVFGILFCVTLNEVRPGQSFVTVRLAIQVKTFYSITLALNFIATTFIAFRIWKIQKAASSYSRLDSELMRVTVMIIESGALYSAWLLILIGTYASGSPSMFIFLNSISPVIGIVFSAVIVRVGMGVSAGDSHRELSSRVRHARSGEASFPDGVQISLSQTIHTHHDDTDDSVVPEDKEQFTRKPDGFAV